MVTVKSEARLAVEFDVIIELNGEKVTFHVDLKAIQYTGRWQRI